ncbi:MAG: AmmeMemoRadiSam system protein B, partial [Deltaproteobacteria bacterium]|nr:AmmeMemoRadiSam system protein B [Deltaproteobacteria bacterium]
MDQELKPKLRPVAAFPVETKDGRLAVLKDMTGISPEILTVNESVLFVLQFFDGNHSIADIKTNFFKASGSFLYDEQIEPVITKLDESHFLEGENFERYLASLIEEFKRGNSRKAAHAGSGYPAGPDELREFLAGFFREARGETAPPVSGRFAGMIVPHLDLRLAGNLYARAYSAVRKSGCRTFIIMGTGHSGASHGYILTRKDFETPLGTVKCDRELTEKILEASPYDLTDGEFLHKNEHTIEFQTLFLKYLFPDEEIRIVPILCSFDYRELSGHPDPDLRRFLSDFPRVLADIVGSNARDAAYIASVDFAHVGPRYGD